MTTEYTIPMDRIRVIPFRDHRCDNLRGKITKITTLQQIWPNYNPRDPITLSDDDWGVQSPPKRKLFRFHYHSQKVITSRDPGDPSVGGR